LYIIFISINLYLYIYFFYFFIYIILLRLKQKIKIFVNNKNISTPDPIYKMSRNFNDDYNNGKVKENEVYNIIVDFFNDNIKQSKEKYSPYDFVGDKNLYELKSRTNNYNTYPTTMITTNKIYDNKNNNKTLIMIFNFTDGLYYIKNDIEIFKSFKTTIFQRTGRIGTYDKPKEMLWIPIDKLIKIK